MNMASPYYNWVGAFFNRTNWARPSWPATRIQCWTSISLRVSIGVVLSEQVSTRVGLLPMLLQGILRVLCKTCDSVPNTVLDEADFSVIGCEKNDYRHNLMDSSFEGIIQAKQYKCLHTLAWLQACGLLTIQQLLMFTMHLYDTPISQY